MDETMARGERAFVSKRDAAEKRFRATSAVRARMSGLYCRGGSGDTGPAKKYRWPDSLLIQSVRKRVKMDGISPT
jgi:hypothetical protein